MSIKLTKKIAWLLNRVQKKFLSQLNQLEFISSLLFKVIRLDQDHSLFKDSVYKGKATAVFCNRRHSKHAN